MARIRYLKPDFFKDEDLAELPYWVRLLYAGLWNIADKAGRLEDRSKRIKIEIFPYDKIDIEKGLKLLAQIKKNNTRSFIIRYTINNERYIQIPTWDKHQKPHHTERESNLPPIPPSYKQNGEDKDNGDGECHEGMTEVSNGEITVKSKDFDDIWTKYPNKVGKKEALRHFKATIKTPKDLTDINRALENYLKSERVHKGYVQNAGTWFSNWQDWLDYSEDICPKCKGKGKYTSSTGYEVICNCPKGLTVKK